MAGNDVNTLLLLHGEDLTDASQYARVLTNSGVTVSDAQSKFGGKSLHFNGSNAYLKTACLITGNQPFTIDCWAYPTAVRNNTVWSHGGTNAAAVKGGGVELYGAGTLIYYCSGFLVQGGSYTADKWHHVAIVGDGTNITLYLNGVSIGIYTGGYNFATYEEIIGANASAYGQENFQGYIDELRISNVARWTGNFTPPSAAYEYDKPSMPQNLTYAINVTGSIELTWDDAQYATKYEISRNGTTIATTLETRYTDLEAISGKTYVYVVTPYNYTQAGESATITVRTALDTPASLNAMLDGTNVTLTWNAVSGAEGYKVYRDGAVVASVTNTSYTDTIAPPTSVAYAVSAYLGSIQSGVSDAVVVENWEGVLLTLITDRTAADVAEAKRLRDKVNAGEALTDEESARYFAGPRGAYNANDMNRVGAAVRYVADRLNAEGYGAHVSPKTDWQIEDIVLQSDWNKYIDEVRHLRRKLTLMRTTPQIINGMYSGLKSYAEANAIEQILVDLDWMLTNIIRNYIYAGEVFAGEV